MSAFVTGPEKAEKTQAAQTVSVKIEGNNLGDSCGGGCDFTIEGGGGIKHDNDKPDLSLVPRALLEETAYAFMHGAKKYGRYNYLKGLDSTRLIAAAMRHLAAYADGEEYDADGFHTLGGASASIGMLLDLRAKQKLADTRYNK